MMNKTFKTLFIIVLLLAGCSEVQKGVEDSKPEEDLGIPITFQPMDIELFEVKEIQSIDIGKVVKEHKTEQGTFIIFSKPSDENQFYSGFIGNSQHYQIGDLGYSLENLNIKPVSIFGIPTMRMQGICGAMCPINQYVIIDENQPKVFYFSNWNMLEADLEGDGENELIAGQGLNPDSKIIKYKNGQFIESDLFKELLNANSVIYDGEFGLFSAASEDGLKNYKYEDERLKQVSEVK